MYMSLFSTCGWILRLAVTVALLVSIHPALALLTLCALPPVLTSTWRPGVERRAQERGAAANRLARHLFDVATTASPGKEVRVTGIADLLMRSDGRRGRRARRRSRRRAGSRQRGTRRPGRSSAPATSARSSSSPQGLGAPAGDVLLVLAAGSRLSFYVGADGRRDRLPARHLDGRVAAPGLARGLCGVGRGHGRPAVAPAPGAGHPVRARLVRLSGHRPAGARRRVARLAGRHGGGDRRRERRRQVDAGEAARQAVRPDPRAHPGRRRGSRGASRPSTGARAWPAPSRTSSASSSPPATRSASAICRASTMARR